jgi:hypothetical protein
MSELIAMGTYLKVSTRDVLILRVPKIFVSEQRLTGLTAGKDLER